MNTEVIETASQAETEHVATAVAGRLRPGDVVLLSGDLGTGKTTFVRSACAALGIAAKVTSPTFTIGSVYAGVPEVAHLDLYRLAEVSAEDDAMLDDYVTGDRISFIEWPKPGSLADRARLRVSFEHLGADARRLQLDWQDPQ